MSLTAHRKRAQDRARFARLEAQHPNLLREALALLFGSKPDAAIGQRRASERLRQRFGRGRADTAILRQLVGRGYLRPEGEVYRLTRSGRALVALAAGFCRS